MDTRIISIILNLKKKAQVKLTQNQKKTNHDDSIVLFTIAMIAMFHGLQYSETIESIVSGDIYV